MRNLVLFLLIFMGCSGSTEPEFKTVVGQFDLVSINDSTLPYQTGPMQLVRGNINFHDDGTYLDVLIYELTRDRSQVFTDSILGTYKVDENNVVTFTMAVYNDTYTATWTEPNLKLVFNSFTFKYNRKK